jgi:hypothetical protein
MELGMKILWIKLMSDGEIKKTVSQRSVPSVGDGIRLDEIGYKVIGVVETPHLEYKVHVFVAETPN